MKKAFGLLFAGAFLAMACCLGILLGHLVTQRETVSRPAAVENSFPETTPLKAAALPRLEPIPVSNPIVDPAVVPAASSFVAALVAPAIMGQVPAPTLSIESIDGKPIQNNTSDLVFDTFPSKPVNVVVHVTGLAVGSKVDIFNVTESLGFAQTTAVPQITIPVTFKRRGVFDLDAKSGMTAAASVKTYVVSRPTLNLSVKEKLIDPITHVVEDQGPSLIIAATVSNTENDVPIRVEARRTSPPPDPNESALKLAIGAQTTPKQGNLDTMFRTGTYQFNVMLHDRPALDFPLQAVQVRRTTTRFVPTIKLLREATSYEFDSPSGVQFLRTGALTIVAMSPDSTRRLLVRDEKGDPVSSVVPVTSVLNENTAVLEVPPGKLKPGRHTLTVIDQWTEDQSLPLTVVVPVVDQPIPPRITHVSNGKEVPPEVATATATVYGRFLRLQGTGFPRDGKLHFLVFKPRSEATTVFQRLEDAANVVRPTPNGEWDADLTLPVFRGAGQLFVVAEQGATHSFSAVLSLNVLDNGIANETAPQVTKITDKTLDSPTPKAVLLNRQDFDITGTPNPPAGAVVVIRDVRTRQVLSRPAAPPGNGGWGVTVKGLAPERYTLQAEYARGDEYGKASPPFEIVIRTTGPRVKSVIPPNFGTAPGVQVLTIEFSVESPLAQTPAELPGNYRLRASGGTGSFDRGNEIEITPTTATLDPQRNAVILKFADPNKPLLPDIYQLVIDGAPVSTNANAGLRDLFGNFLEGIEGKPGTPYKLALSKPVPTGAAESTPGSAPTRGLAGTTGPYVPFKEFNDPRPESNGFNPSDKVITRVARLYYFRDAHRVAQIVNRKAQSYHRQAVDMKQQLADKSRAVAEKAVDDRRAQERAAVQAAKESRQAEEMLSQFQQALMAARQQAADVGGKLTAANDRIERTQQELKAAQDAAQAAAQSPQTPTPAAPVAPAAVPVTLAPAPDIPQLQRQLLTAQLEQKTLTAADKQATSEVEIAEQRVRAALADVQAKRKVEVQATEETNVAEARELRTQEELFRREVAAAHEDPDTYAPGKPESFDPVEQVSISVIGEGVIQLRGPVKGVNLVHTMINEIDAPVGQVRVAVHTVQINGEHGNRMEKVAAFIQRYIDHSRFLTTQSAQMLRNAVVLVASRRAEAIALQCPDDFQEARDQKYLEAFFGRDFINELRTLDSEFLHTGNKVLSLHSMDSTSLASALFLLALAKNGTRQEILAEFDRMVQMDLPTAEQEFFLAAGSANAYGCKKFLLMAPNSRFASFKGCFNAIVEGDDTLNPVQREFIRLAQIFKSRLVTEIELQQRVMERGLIEQRLGNYLKELEKARDRDEMAQRQVQLSLSGRAEAQQVLVLNLVELLALMQPVVTGVTWVDEFCATSPDQLATDLNSFTQRSEKTIQFHGRSTRVKIVPTKMVPPRKPADDPEGRNDSAWREFRRAITIQPVDERLIPLWKDDFKAAVQANENLRRFVEQFRFKEQPNKKTVETEADYMDELRADLDRNPDSAPFRLRNFYVLCIARERYLQVKSAIDRYKNDVHRRVDSLILQLRDSDVDVKMIYSEWHALQMDILAHTADPALYALFSQILHKVDQSFRDVVVQDIKVQFALEFAKRSRRPLDHKKFLDMLIDDAEAKFIELVEGTRAHTANIDGYVKRLATALEDDFNTQFYFPAFRGAREASRFWDVNVAQIETTSILTNNREFAKVSPQATMEFDLPKRDLVVTEAFQAARAAYADYGALLADPNFLSLTKLYSGQPTSSPFGSASPAPLVRSVLPGLPSSTDERLVLQGQTNQPQFSSQLEGLIPDPAIYKFETGTGFEIRPVIQPDGQSVVFHLNYMYTTNIREPVRADEKHLGRVKRHFIDTDVQTGNYELREVSRYQVALKASRTSRGVPLLEDMPGVGILFRPLPQQESSLQENLILAQSTIFPTLFDLMGLRWAPAVADLDALRLRESEFVVRNRQRALRNQVFDISSGQVDEFMRTPAADRRSDLYRPQETIPAVHPNGYRGPGLNLQDSHLQEGFDPRSMRPQTEFAPGASKEGVPFRRVEELPQAPASIHRGSSPPRPRPPAPPQSQVPNHNGVTVPEPSAPLKEQHPAPPADAPTSQPQLKAPPQSRGSTGKSILGLFKRPAGTAGSVKTKAEPRQETVIQAQYEEVAPIMAANRPAFPHAPIRRKIPQ